jgi:hypothetical protein
MNDQDSAYLHGGAMSVLLKEHHETMEDLFARFEKAEDGRTKREIVEAALHELKVCASIEELMLHSAFAELERAEKAPAPPTCAVR